MNKKSVVLKITGQFFLDKKTQKLCRTFADGLAQEVKQLTDEYLFSIVMGGGAFFRGNQHNGINLRPNTAHTIGMCATVVNSLMLYDIFVQHGINCTILSALDGSFAGIPASQMTIDSALNEKQIIIFSGGTGSPYVSTDTCAIIRARQLDAQEVWKLTDVPGVFTDDPHCNSTATFIQQLSYQEALDKQLCFMDYTALILAQQERMVIRVFNGFESNALVQASTNNHYGTTIK